MDTQLLPISFDQAVFDFSGLPLSPVNVSVAAHKRDRLQEPTPEALELAPLSRKLLPWIVAQVLAAIGLGTCLVQAMPLTTATSVQADHTHFALRLSNSPEVLAPLPTNLRDGFRLRYGSTE